MTYEARDGDATIRPRAGISLCGRPTLGDDGIVVEVFDWNVYRIDHQIRGKVVIDCGAHIGSLSVLCASLGAKAVYAIEPQPDNLRLLRHNAEPYPQITVIEAAVGAVPGDVFVGGESGQAHTLGSRAADPDSHPVRQITLASILDDYDLAEVDLLKADCEGGEMSMIVGCDHDHLRRIARIEMEWHGLIFHRDAPAHVPGIGELVEHLQYTHNVEVTGTPDQWGQLHGLRP